MSRDFSFPHAAGSINGAGAAFALGADGRPCQLGCGNLIRLAAGDYTIDLDIPLDASECSIVPNYRTAAPAMPVGGSVRDRECYAALAAGGAGMIAPYGPGAVDDAVGPWFMPMPGRTVQIQRIGVGGNVVVATITGEAMDGTVGVTETINLPAVAAVYNAGAARRAFRRITRFQCPALGGAVTASLQTGDGFGIAGNIDLLVGTGPIVSGTLDGAPQVWSAARGTVVPDDGTGVAVLSPNGVRDYDVLFSRPSPVGTAPAIQVIHVTEQRKRFLLGAGGVGAATDGSFDFVVFRTQL